jgi:hypothetical protein
MILLSVLFCGMYDDSVLRIAFMLGLFTQYALHSLSSHLMSGMAGGKSSHAAGWVGFCYLEVLDASFSFDGVVGAFALTDHLLVIMVGLGIGAFFVRSLTIYLVDHQSITHLRYLDHGAHYAILSLAIVMMIKITGHLPEWLVGSISAIFIVASIGHSLLEKRVTRKKMKKLS